MRERASKIAALKELQVVRGEAPERGASGTRCGWCFGLEWRRKRPRCPGCGGLHAAEQAGPQETYGFSPIHAFSSW